jgi:hypothetical protein
MLSHCDSENTAGERQVLHVPVRVFPGGDIFKKKKCSGPGFYHAGYPAGGSVLSPQRGCRGVP